jgi:cell division protein FtsX
MLRLALACLLLAGCGASTEAPPGPEAVAGQSNCAAYPSQLVLFIDTDAQMEAAATRVRADKRVGAIATVDQAMAYEEFKKLFATQPELVELTTPESLPASIWIATARGVEKADLAEQLRRDFPQAQQIETDPCGVDRGLVPPSPTN